MKVSKFADILQLSEKEFLSFPKKYRKISGNHGGTSPWYNNLQQVEVWSAFLSNMSATHCMQQDAAVRLHFIFHSNPKEESRLLSAIGDARYSLRDRRKKDRGTWEKVPREKGSKIWIKGGSYGRRPLPAPSLPNPLAFPFLPILWLCMFFPTHDKKHLGLPVNRLSES